MAFCTARKPWQIEVADIADAAVAMGDEVASGVMRAADVVGVNDVADLGVPFAGYIVAEDRARDLPLGERVDQVGMVHAAENHGVHVRVFMLELRDVQRLGRRRRRVVIRHEQQLPVVLRAVTLGAQQQARLEAVQHVTVAEEKSDDPRLVPAPIREIDAQLFGRAQHAVANCRVDGGVARGDTRDGRRAHLGELRHAMEGWFLAHVENVLPAAACFATAILLRMAALYPA